MKNKILSAILSVFLVSLVFSYWEKKEYSPSERLVVNTLKAYPQTVKKPEFDYMSTILSRNTKPLGLKENPVLKKFLSQSLIKWAVRSEEKHILN